MDLKEASLIGGDISRHWYYRAKLRLVLRMVNNLPPCTLVDVGAGTGFFSRSLLTSGRITKAICVDPGYSADSEELIGNRPIWFRRSLGNVRPDIGIVLMMDVLEHVEDDRGLAREYASLMPSGSCMLVTAPAFQWLWSEHDVFLGHYRRYAVNDLEDVIASAGLKIEAACYYYGAVLPIAIAFRLGKRLFSNRGHSQSDMRQFGRLSNSFLKLLCRAEEPFLNANRWAGLSVVIRARKP